MNNNDMNQDNELFERVEEIMAAVHAEKDKVQSNHIQCIGKIDTMMLLPDEEIENIAEYNEMDRMFIRHITYLFSKMLTVVSAVGEDTFIDEHDDIKIMFTHWYALMTSYTVEMSELLTMYSKHYFDIHEFTGDNQSEAVKSFVSSSEKGFNDYYEMQQSWTFFTDGLCRDGQITLKQFENWGNPTTVEKFKSWHKRNFGTERK